MRRIIPVLSDFFHSVPIVCNLFFVAEKVFFCEGLTHFMTAVIVMNGSVFSKSKKAVFLSALPGFNAVIIVMDNFIVAEKVLFLPAFSGFIAVCVVVNDPFLAKAQKASFYLTFADLVAVIVVVDNLFVAENIGYFFAFHFLAPPLKKFLFNSGVECLLYTPYY